MPSETSVHPVAAAYDWYVAFQRFVTAHPGLENLAKLLGGKASVDADRQSLLHIHEHAIGAMHISRKPALRANLAKVAKAFANARAPGVLEDLVAAGDADSDVARWAAGLDGPGYTDLPPIDADQVRAMLDWLDAGGLIRGGDIRKSMESLPPLPAEDLRATENLGHVPPTRVLETPGLGRLATDRRLLEAVRRHLGAPPILIDASAWRSFAGIDGAKEAREAQLFHFDLDDYRFCKMFVYLTNVDADGGPHVFVPETHRMETIVAVRNALGPHRVAAFDRWYFSQLRKSEAEVRDWLGRDPVSLTGPAGSRFLVNTEGIHRGTPPRTHDRWVVQLVFGITPFTFWDVPYAKPALKDWDGSPLEVDGPAARYALQLLAPQG